MTRPDLDAIRARCEAATPGPWKVQDHDGWYWEVVKIDEEDDGWMPDAVFDDGSSAGEYGATCKPHDRDFLVSARTDIPALLAYVEELTEERDEERMRTRCFEQAMAEAQADLDETREALHATQSKSDYWRNEFRNERLTFESCNRARQAAEDECAELRARVAELEARRWNP